MPGTALPTLSPLATMLDKDRELYQSDTREWLPLEQIAVRLTTPRTIDNPDEPAQVQRPINVDEAIGLLSGETCAKLAAAPPIVDFVDKANAGNIAGAMRWIGFAAKAGLLTADEIAALRSLATATIQDPAWSPTVTLPPAVSRINVKDIDAAIKEIENAL